MGVSKHSKHTRKSACIIFATPILLFTSKIFAEQRLTANEAANHIGEQATVCGNVASSRFADRTRGQPTFLNLEKPYPNQIFTVVIWGEDRAKFGAPETKYRDKRICVSGTITEYRGSPEIVAKEPAQIQEQAH